MKRGMVQRVALVAGLGIAAIGCGGGGGSDGGYSPPAVKQAPVGVSMVNQIEAVEVTLEAIEGPPETSGAVSKPGAGSAPAAVADVGAITRRFLARGPAQALKAAPRASVSHSGTEQCAVAGRIKLTITLADPYSGMIRSGDSMELAYENCVEQPGLTLNGIMRATFTQNLDPFCSVVCQVAARFSFDNFRQKGATGTHIVHGTLSVHELDNLTSITTAFSQRASDTLYLVELDGEALRLSNFGLSEVRNKSNHTYASTLTGLTVASTVLDGSIAVSGTFAGTLDGSGDYQINAPDSGDLDIVGAGGSTLNANWSDRTTLTLTLDQDGDGNPEGMADIAWSDLD